MNLFWLCTTYRSDGEEVTVDNKFLRAHHHHLVRLFFFSRAFLMHFTILKILTYLCFFFNSSYLISMSDISLTGRKTKENVSACR